MKTLIATLLVLLIPTASLAGKDVNPADFPLSARVLSYESGVVGSGPSTTINPQTGAVSGYTSGSWGRIEKEEIQIGDKIYTTEIWGRGGVSGGVGDSFPAAFGKRGRFETILLLGTNKKTGRAEVVTLKVVGQRVSQ